MSSWVSRGWSRRRRRRKRGVAQNLVQSQDMLSEEAPEEQEATVCCEREQVRRYGVSPQDRNKKKKHRISYHRRAQKDRTNVLLTRHFTGLLYIYLDNNWTKYQVKGDVTYSSRRWVGVNVSNDKLSTFYTQRPRWKFKQGHFNLIWILDYIHVPFMNYFSATPTFNIVISLLSTSLNTFNNSEKGKKTKKPHTSVENIKTHQSPVFVQ